MRLAWHIARKDLFRLRTILLLWAALLTGQMGLALIQSNLDANGYFPFLMGAWVFSEIFVPLLGLGIVMAVLHDDSACDSDAFWLTRPIAGGLLLRSKLIVLFILAAFPALVLMPWWIAHGYEAGQLARAVVHTTWQQLAITLFALPLAALSATTARFVMQVFVAAVIFVLLSLAYVSLGENHVFTLSPLNASVGGRVMVSAWFASGVTVVVHQYLTRRTRRSFLLAVGGVGLGFVGSVFLSSVAFSSTHSGPISVPEIPQLVAMLPSDVGRTSLNHGFRLRVNESYPLYPQSWVMSVNESSPVFTAPKGITAPLTAVPAGHEFYFLVNRSDGRAVRANVGSSSETLNEGALLIGTLGYSRRELSFLMPGWTRDASDSFKAWVAHADLVKIIADADLKDFPSEFHPLSPSP